MLGLACRQALSAPELRHVNVYARWSLLVDWHRYSILRLHDVRSLRSALSCMQRCSMDSPWASGAG